MKILTKNWAKKFEQVKKACKTIDFRQEDKLLKEVEKCSLQAIILTQIAENYLSNNLMFDELVGEFVRSEYSKDKSYFIELKHLKICIENYQILERENFKINETIIYSAELHHTLNNRFEVHLLLENKNEYLCKRFFYFTLSGTDIKLYQCFE